MTIHLNKLHMFSEKLLTVIVLNFFIWIECLLGLVIFGIGPMLYGTFKWLAEKEKIEHSTILQNLFFQFREFRKGFWRVNRCLLPNYLYLAAAVYSLLFLKWNPTFNVPLLQVVLCLIIICDLYVITLQSYLLATNKDCGNIQRRNRKCFCFVCFAPFLMLKSCALLLAISYISWLIPISSVLFTSFLTVFLLFTQFVRIEKKAARFGRVQGENHENHNVSRCRTAK